MIEIRDAHGKLRYRNSFVTDLPVNRENVAELAASPSYSPHSRDSLTGMVQTSGIA
jgi:hypothetical protein